MAGQDEAKPVERKDGAEAVEPKAGQAGKGLSAAAAIRKAEEASKRLKQYKPKSKDGPREVIIRTEEVKKIYGMGGEKVYALRGVNLEIYKGEYLSIMGPSGSGKSTFFNMVGGLDTPSEGKVFIKGHDVATLSTAQQAFMRCHFVGYIFQCYNILEVMTALENVTLPMVFAGLSADEARDKGAHLLDMVGMGDRLNHTPNELSGGQQQRVAIARALANDPEIILADEPTANLDSQTGAAIIELLSKLKDEHDVTVITATHDHKMLAASDRVVWIRDGRVDRVELRENLKIQVGTI